MCLFVKDFDLKIAKEDICVYKIIIILSNKLVTPYRGMEIDSNITYKSELILEPLKNRVISKKVNIGLHSFESIKACKNIRLYDFMNAANVKIYACTIPKGSHYYIGNFIGKLGKATSYASDALIYNEDIEL